MLDNASDPAQLRPLLPGSRAAWCWSPAGSQLTGLVVAEGAHRLTLDLLSWAEARELLARLWDRPGSPPNRGPPTS